MKCRFYKDPATGELHIAVHGVTPGEVEEVLASPGETRRGVDDSMIAIGQTLGGRFLKVVYVPDEELSSVFVVTAFDLGLGTPKAFRRRMERKNKKI